MPRLNFGSVSVTRPLSAGGSVLASAPWTPGPSHCVAGHDGIAGVGIEWPLAVTATVEFSHQKRSIVLAVFIGVTGALAFGSADFAGGRAAKRTSAVRTSAVRTSAIRPMSTLSPVTAEISAVVPVLGGAVRGGRLIVVGYAAIVVAVAAVVAVIGLAAVEPVRFVPIGYEHEKGAVRPSPGALAMAVPSAGGRTC